MTVQRQGLGLWRRLSLTTRLLVGSGFALAAFGATLLYTSVSRDVAVYRTTLDERLESELAFIALTVTEQAVIGDYASLRQMLDARVLRARDVRSIVWTDPRGNPVGVEARTPTVMAPPWFVALVDMPDPRGTQPIVVGGVSYGELSLHLSATSVVDRIWGNVQYGMQMLLIVTGVIFAFIIAIVTGALRPLNELASFAKRFGEGDVAVRLPATDTPELAATVDALNRMAEGLNVLLLSLDSARATLAQEKEKAEVTLASIADAVLTTGIDGRIEFANAVAERLCGFSRDESEGRPLDAIIDLRDGGGPLTASLLSEVLGAGRPFAGSGHYALVSRLGHRTAVEISAAPIRNRDAVLVGAVIVIHDVSQTHQMATELSWQATHDSLTGLVNRREFERRLELLVERAQQDGSEHCFLYIDLDQFKIVNDTSGHVAGDELLRQVCALLQRQVRDSDTLARLGGDEFGVLLEHCHVPQGVQVANKMLEAMAEFRFIWQTTSYPIGMSTGLVPITAAESSKTAILSAADAACYSAKERGRNRVQVYREDDTELAQRQGEMQWVARINRAIETDRICLYFQSIEALGGVRDSGDRFEILVRMRDDAGDLVMPMAFIPAAERYNLMPAIDREIIRKAFDAFDRIYARPGANRRLLQASINLSGSSLGDEGIELFIRQQFATHAVRPDQICFEITETAAITNLTRAIGFIRDIKALGCCFSLDDFGSGLSSFAYLKSLPVDTLKIDGSFVKDMPQDPIDTAMVRAINSIGHVMGLKTVAEFVENDIILGMLKEIGVDYAQGYGIAKPAPLDDLV